MRCGGGWKVQRQRDKGKYEGEKRGKMKGEN